MFVLYGSRRIMITLDVNYPAKSNGPARLS